MPQVPMQLIDWRFVLINKGEKAPFEAAWQKDANYAFGDQRFREWIRQGGNYGVIGTEQHFVIDIDNHQGDHRQHTERMLQIVGQLPETFVVETGGGGLHYYYNGRLEAPIRLRAPNDSNINLGDIQGPGKQVVGPGSIHPNGNMYKTHNNRAIATVPNAEETLRDLFSEFIKPEPPPSDKQEEWMKAALEYKDAPLLSDIVDTSAMRQQGNEYYGPHPTHGSTGGQNFWIDLTRGVWHCFRHGSGGGSWQLLAVTEGIIPCEEARKGSLRGELFKRVKQIAVDRDLIEGKPTITNGTYAGVLGDIEELDRLKLTKAEIAYNEAEHLLEAHMFARSKEDDVLWHYLPDQGVWVDEGEDLVHIEAGRHLKEYANNHMRNEIVGHLKIHDKCRKVYRGDFNQRPELVVTANGVIDTSTEPYRVLPHSPDYLFTTKINAEYDPDASGDYVKDFMLEIMSELDAKVTLECIGYCLHRGFPFDISWMGIGGGRNGKSTLLELLKTFLGERNVSHQALQELTTNRFAIARLFGKLANIFYDIPVKGLKDTGIWKATSGGDTLDAEEKFVQKAISFKPFAKQFYSCNELPPTKDISDAFMRRWRIITFPNVFVEENPQEGERKADPHLTEKLCEPKNLSGLLNLALEALQDALRRGYITRNETLEELRDKWQRESNPVMDFIDKHINIDPIKEAIREETYSAFVKYCVTKKRPPWTKNAFNQEFQKQTGAQYARSSDKTIGRPPIWRGVELTNQPDTKQTPQEQLTNTPLEEPINSEANDAKLICRAAETETTPRSAIEKAGLNGEKAMRLIRRLIKDGYLAEPSIGTIKWNQEAGKP